MICDYHSRLHAIASYLGMHSSTTKSREVSMNNENGGNDEDGEDHCDEINRDTEAERIGSNLAKRMRLIKESQGKCYLKSDKLHECMRSTSSEKLDPVMSCRLLDNARTTLVPENELKRLELEIKKLKLSINTWHQQKKKMELDYKRIALPNKDKKLENEKMRLEIYRMKLELKQKDKDREVEVLQLKQKELEIRSKRSRLQ